MATVINVGVCYMREKKKKKISQRQLWSIAIELAHPLWAGDGWLQLSSHTTYVGQMVGSINSFNRLLYASSPDHRAYCYAGLAILPPAVSLKPSAQRRTELNSVELFR